MRGVCVGGRTIPGFVHRDVHLLQLPAELWSQYAEVPYRGGCPARRTLLIVSPLVSTSMDVVAALVWFVVTLLALSVLVALPLQVGEATT